MNTLQATLTTAWIAGSEPEHRTRRNFESFYQKALKSMGKHPTPAVIDDAGNCTSCGESGRCPGWHYAGELFD